MKGLLLTVLVMVGAVFLGAPEGEMATQAKELSGKSDSDLTLHHVGISVPDLDASIAWYREMLGFEEVRRMHQAANPEMSFAIIRRGPVRVELFEVVDGRKAPDYRHDPTADLHVHGVKHFALEVTDVRAMVAELKAKGVTVSKEITESPRTIFVFINDNAGNAIELIQPKE